jgi:hypothetical protein
MKQGNPGTLPGRCPWCCGPVFPGQPTYGRKGYCKRSCLDSARRMAMERRQLEAGWSR